MIETIIFRIDGLYIKPAKKIIEKKLKETKGIKKAVVNFKTKTAKIVFDSKRITFGKIKEILAIAGYGVFHNWKKNSIGEA